jgi:hypothetical protein
VRSGVIEGVRIGLGGDGLFLLHRLYVVESRGEVYERDDHPMQIANHVVKNMGDGHVQPRSIFSLRQFKRNQKFFERDPDIGRAGSEIFDHTHAKQPEIGEHNMDTGSVMHSTKAVELG